MNMIGSQKELERAECLYGLKRDERC